MKIRQMWGYVLYMEEEEAKKQPLIQYIRQWIYKLYAVCLV